MSCNANSSGRGTQEDTTMELLATTVLPMAAIGYSLIYMLMGGGFVGAFLIFFLAKMLGK